MKLWSSDSKPYSYRFEKCVGFSCKCLKWKSLFECKFLSKVEDMGSFFHHLHHYIQKYLWSDSSETQNCAFPLNFHKYSYPTTLPLTKHPYHIPLESIFQIQVHTKHYNKPCIPNNILHTMIPTHYKHSLYYSVCCPPQSSSLLIMLSTSKHLSYYVTP